MRSGVECRAVLILIVLTGGLCLSAALGADYRQSYLDGVRAARRGEWQEVVRRMREAIAEEPAPRERARLVGVIPDPYLPYYYLGKAHFELGDCNRALDAWRASLRHGAVRSQEELVRVLEEGMGHCEAQSPPAENEPVPAENEAPPAENEAPRQEGEPADDLAVVPAEPAAIPPAGDREPSGEEPETRLEGPAPAPPTPEPAISPPPAAPSPPAWLVAAAQAFLDGEPVLCLTLLAEHPDPEGRAIVFAHLFRGAARYALYLRAGERDAAALEIAAADLRECRRHDPTFTPSATYFSPRFIQFFSIVTAPQM